MPFCGKVASKVVESEDIVVVVESWLCVEREFELYSIQLKFRLIKFFLPFYRTFHKGVKDRYKKTNNNHTFLLVFIFYFLLMDFLFFTYGFSIFYLWIFYFLLMDFLFFIWLCIIYALTTKSPSMSPSPVGGFGLVSIPTDTFLTAASSLTVSSSAPSYQL